MEGIFVNKFITIGFNSIINGDEKNIFEKHIIECLFDIYGKNNLINTYKNKDINEFENILLKYGFPNRFFDDFIKETNNYESFIEKREHEKNLKTDSTSKIEIKLAQMFFYKTLIVEPSLETISHFENNLLNNFYIIKYNFECTKNPNMSRLFWDDKKREVDKSKNVILREVKPKYLDSFTYARFGVKLEDVEKMDYRMVNELNKYITTKMEEKPIEIKEKKNPFEFLQNTVVTSGNGFVDAILIASIIATEMSIGIIYLFLKM